MPPKKRNKLKDILGQPSVLSLVSETVNINTPSGGNNHTRKTRTPPTPQIHLTLKVTPTKDQTCR